MTIRLCTQIFLYTFVAKKMNLFDFPVQFPDEDTCIKYFREKRESLGITCAKCSNTTHYWKKDKKAFQCKKCGYRTSLRTGTALANSQLPYLYWFKAIHLLSATKKTFSAFEIQRQLKHDRYEPIWSMLHRIREAMGRRDCRYRLSEYIEIDEGFFETINDKESDDANSPKKRGRGSQKQAKVLVLIESKPVVEKSEKYKHKPDRQVGHIKMIVMDDLKSTTINKVVENGVEKGTDTISDAYKGYNNLESIIGNHEIINTSAIKESHKVLPWVHSAIGNAKKILQGIHHSNKQEYLQNYLDEFCYKYNRRYFGDKVFDRLMLACIEYS